MPYRLQCDHKWEIICNKNKQKMCIYVHIGYMKGREDLSDLKCMTDRKDEELHCLAERRENL